MVRQIKIGKGIASWYQAKVFPILMDINLGREEIIKERVSILTHASGDILEIGIGTGKNLSCYPKRVKRITAIDSYVRKIENDSIEVDLRPYECENMEFEDNSFDVVVSTFCLCSVTDVNKTLQEVRRVLRNNGRLLLLEHGKAHNRFLQYVQKATNPFFNCLACGCNVNRDYFQQMREMGFVMQEESIRRCKIQPSLIAGHLYRAVAIVKKGDDEWKN